MDNEVRDLKEKIKRLENRISQLENRWQIPGRIDLRFMRLEILSYYHSKGRYWQLDEERRRILDDLENLDDDLDFFKNFGRVFFQEYYFTKDKSVDLPKPNPIDIQEKDGSYFWSIRGGQVYLADEQRRAEQIAWGLYLEFFQPSPHNYFDLDEGFTVGSIPDGAIVADVGAAEGLFGMLLVERAKKVYLFENSSYWLPLLEKTYAPYKDKVEIVRGTVGDRAGDIRLDDFFRDKEKPTLVKMDVEGYEAAVLRGMRELLFSEDMLTLLICTYHRQEDWPNFYEYLKDHFDISSSKGYFWHMPDPMPPYFRHGVMRAVKKCRADK